MFKDHFFSASQIFAIEPVALPVGMPAICNLKVSKGRSSDTKNLGGCGLYFFMHHGHLIYIGKSLGTIHNAFGGDIFSARWNRHISTLSLRGSRISISQANLARALSQSLPVDLKDILNAADKVKLAKDRGYMVPYKRLKYAAKNWAEFSGLPQLWLPNIEVGYLQLVREGSITELRKQVSEAERRAIRQIPTVLNGPGEFDDSLMRKFSKDQVFAMLKSMFDVTELSQQNHATDGQSKDISPEVESDHYGERFLEELPSECPQETAVAIYDSLESDVGAQVHHTKTRGGDLRVRSLNARPRVNIFTMYWQSRNQMFSCWIDLAPGNVVGEGVLDVKACPKRKQLTTTFKFDCSQPRATENLIRLIKLALLK